MSEGLFHRIPTELWVHVLEYLPTADLLLLRRVSKSLSHLISTSPELWKHSVFTFRHHWKYIDPILHCIDRQRPYIQQLVLENVRDDVIQDVLPKCTQMKALKFHQWTTLSDHAFSQVGRTLFFAHLTSIELVDEGGMYSAVGTASLVALAHACPELRDVHFWCNAMVDPAATLALVQQCPKIRALSLSTAQHHHERHYLALFMHAPQLRYLHLSHATHLSDTLLAFLPRGLQTLALHSAPVSDTGVRKLHVLAHLYTIKFFDCPKVSLGAMEEIGFESVLYTPSILHKPCFKVGIGFGFHRKPGSSPRPPTHHPLPLPALLSTETDTPDQHENSSNASSMTISIWA